MYDYEVFRDGDSVSYRIFRASKEVCCKQVVWSDLPFLVAVFIVVEGSEKSIKRQMVKAHKLAKYAIKTLIRHEKKL